MALAGVAQRIAERFEHGTQGLEWPDGRPFRRASGRSPRISPRPSSWIVRAFPRCSRSDGGLVAYWTKDPGIGYLLTMVVTRRRPRGCSSGRGLRQAVVSSLWTDTTNEKARRITRDRSGRVRAWSSLSVASMSVGNGNEKDRLGIGHYDGDESGVGRPRANAGYHGARRLDEGV